MEEINKNGFVKFHLPCPLCSSSDAVSVNADNSAYCFSCQQYIREYDMELQPTNTNNEYEVKNGIERVKTNVSEDDLLEQVFELNLATITLVKSRTRG